MIMIISVLCMRAYLGVTKVFIIASLGTRGHHLGVGWLLMFPVTTSTSHCSSLQTQIKWQFYFRCVGNFQTCLDFPDPSSFPSVSESSVPILGSRNCGSLLDVEYIILSSLLARVKTKWNKRSGVNWSSSPPPVITLNHKNSLVFMGQHRRQPTTGQLFRSKLLNYSAENYTFSSRCLDGRSSF